MEYLKRPRRESRWVRLNQQTMTRKQAEDIVIEIRRESEEAFRKSGLCEDSRYGFMLGFMQLAFVEALIKENKPVLS